ncbi:hypothetical protein ABS768_12785 [Flavobacterium sp. ST-75]|uniref:MoxR-vWA-beta-propeller ternary system domain-containing protein n=1 Tax=Flavobacterium rhizophilum TaxID=3163296 RepID=A0ABW8YEH9_9FLAO
MAENTSNGVNTYLMEIALKDKSFLSNIRHWENLKAAPGNNVLWIKDITAKQVDSVEIQSIPYKKLYYQRDNLLFLKGNALPEKKMDGTLLWSSLSRILSVELPSFNHNYFGISQKVDVRIVPAETEREPVALLVKAKKAGQYITTAPAIRLRVLSWVVINDSVLLAGAPLLPLEGQTYWMGGDMLLPTGYDFEFPQLYAFAKKAIDPNGDNIILWDKENTYALLPKTEFMPLSVSSFRLTYSDY